MQGPQIRQTRLEEIRTSSVYRTRLAKALGVFEGWVARRYSRAVDWLSNEGIANQLLCEFINDYWTAHKSLWLPKHAVLAAQTINPALRGRLHRAWSALRSWKQHIRSESRVPIPRLLLHGLFVSLVVEGLDHPKDALYWFSAAVLFNIGFHGLLRPGEMLGLRFGDLYFDCGALVIRVANPKNKNAMGYAQFATIRDPGTIAWATWLARGAHPNLKLWPSGRSKLVSTFRTGLAALGAPDKIWTLGGFRAGGATDMIINDTEIARVKFQGRWSSESSMAVYVQEAMSILVLKQLDPRVRSQVENLVRLSHTTLSRPPGLEWEKLFSRKRQWRSLTRRADFENNGISLGELRRFSRQPLAHI